MDLLPILSTVRCHPAVMGVTVIMSSVISALSYSVCATRTKCSQKPELNHYEFNVNPRGSCLQGSGRGMQ